MLYLVGTSEIDVTIWARKLGIPLRAQNRVARGICAPGHVPERFQPDDVIQATPRFMASVEDASEEPGLAILNIVQAISNSGGTIRPPYDVPPSLDRETVERWLASAP